MMLFGHVAVKLTFWVETNKQLKWRLLVSKTKDKFGSQWLQRLKKKRKETCLHCRRLKRCGFSPWVGKIPWRRKWQPTPEFLPGELHGKRNLMGYSLWGRKESDTTEHTPMPFGHFSKLFGFSQSLSCIHVVQLLCDFLLLICLMSMSFLDQPEEPRSAEEILFLHHRTNTNSGLF